MANRFDANRELTRIIEQSLGAEHIFVTHVTPYRDHADEPALSIAVIMKSRESVPDTQAQSALTHRLRNALAEHDDLRFPYLYFRSVDDLSAPDDADEFERLPETPERD